LEVEVAVFRDYEFPLDKPVNFYLVRAGSVSVLVDTGTGRTLSTQALNPSVVVLTHYHWDHSGGLVPLARSGRGALRVCASRRTIEQLSRPSWVLEHMETVGRAVGLRAGPGERAFAEAMYSRYSAISEAASALGVEEVGECLSKMGVVADWLECPGHSDDHICVELGRHLFVGDNIIGSPNVTLSNTYKYFESMTLALARPSFATVHPGHGPGALTRTDAASLLVETMRRKRRRLALAIAAAARGGGRWVGLDEVYRTVYPAPPNPVVAWVAARSLLGYLASLESDGVVEVDRSRSPWRVRLMG